MTEQEVQAMLHPHTGEVEVQPISENDGILIDAVLRSSAAAADALERTAKALKYYDEALSAIAETDNLQGAYAKNMREHGRALLAPSPNLRPMSDAEFDAALGEGRR